MISFLYKIKNTSESMVMLLFAEETKTKSDVSIMLRAFNSMVLVVDLSKL